MSKRILVVEDDGDFPDLLNIVFQESGFILVEVEL